jgi:hypothetical protein
MHYGGNRTLLAESANPKLHSPIGERRKLSPLAEGMFILLEIDDLVNPHDLYYGRPR